MVVHIDDTLCDVLVVHIDDTLCDRCYNKTVWWCTQMTLCVTGVIKRLVVHIDHTLCDRCHKTVLVVHIDDSCVTGVARRLFWWCT